MAMHYRLVQKFNPIKPDDPRKWYANPVSKDEITLRELAKEIAEISTVSIVDTMAVIEAQLQLIPRHVVKGEKVRLADFGSYSAGLSSEGAATEEDFDSDMIKGLKLRFRPGKEFVKQMKDVEYIKD
jgi:predicted histone-like DNA-binding protein